MSRRDEKPDPFDEMSVNYDVPLTAFRMADEMVDDTATDFDVYAQLMQWSADAEAENRVQAVFYEAGNIALQRMNDAND